MVARPGPNGARFALGPAGWIGRQDNGQPWAVCATLESAGRIRGRQGKDKKSAQREDTGIE